MVSESSAPALAAESVEVNKKRFFFGLIACFVVGALLREELMSTTASSNNLRVSSGEQILLTSATTPFQRATTGAALSDIVFPSSFRASVPAWVWSLNADNGGAKGTSGTIMRLDDEEDPEFITGQWLSQAEEDKTAYQYFFYNVKNGIMLESGALDGITSSVSHAFVKTLGWRAVHIEPGPKNFKDLASFRPESLDVQAAICATLTEVHVADRGGTGGILEFMSDDFKRLWWPDVMNDPQKINEFPTVTCMPVATVLHAFGIRHVDFWVLDVEGAELLVLQGMDFSAVTINVIAIECDGTNTEKEDKIEALLNTNGFKKEGKVGANIWYMRKEGFTPSRKPGIAKMA